MNFKREFRQLRARYYVYKGFAMKDVRLLIATLSSPPLNDLLVHKKPPRSLLTKMEPSLTLEEQKEEEEEKEHKQKL